MTQLKEKLKTLWPFYRTIYPEDDTLSSAKFPNLSKAALTYVKNFVNTSVSFKRVILPQHETYPNCVLDAETRVDAYYLKTVDFQGRLNDLSPEIRTTLFAFGIDVAKWRPPQLMRDRLIMDPPNRPGAPQELFERIDQLFARNQAPNI